MTKRKKIRAIKKNKEIIRNYKKVKNALAFCGDVNIKLTCSKCKRVYVIRIKQKDLELYTDQVRKDYVCLLCRR